MLFIEGKEESTMQTSTEVIADACDCAIDLKARQAQIVRLTAGILAILTDPHVPPSLLLFRRWLQRPRGCWSKYNNNKQRLDL